MFQYAALRPCHQPTEQIIMPSQNFGILVRAQTPLQAHRINKIGEKQHCNTMGGLIGHYFEKNYQTITAVYNISDN